MWVGKEMVDELYGTTIEGDEEYDSLLAKVKSSGSQIIAHNVEDSMALTEVISSGVEYAVGNFIGEPMTQLDDVTNVESFEII